MTTKQTALVNFLRANGRVLWNGHNALEHNGKVFPITWNWLMKAADCGFIKMHTVHGKHHWDITTYFYV